MNQPRHKITVLLSPGDFQKFQTYCRERGFKKSTLIARLIREHMDLEGYRTQPELPLERPNDEE